MRNNRNGDDWNLLSVIGKKQNNKIWMEVIG